MYKPLGNGRFLLPKEMMSIFNDKFTLMKKVLYSSTNSDKYSKHYIESLDNVLMSQIIADHFLDCNLEVVLSNHHVTINAHFDNYSIDITIGNISSKDKPEFIIGYIKDNN